MIIVMNFVDLMSNICLNSLQDGKFKSYSIISMHYG